ncbi:MFS transporter [Archangium sp.]|uniref:MFS transporter n=1 Tax=Archangium sp. TaxID=1872627 RepID=UPI0038D4E60C
MIGRALLGVVIGGFWSLSAATVMRLVPEKDVPRALALLNGGNALATTIAAPLGSFLGQYIGWRGAFFVVVPLAAITLVWQFFTLPGLPTERAAPPPSTFAVLRRPKAAAGILAVTLLFMGQFALFTYLRPFLETVTRVWGSRRVPRSEDCCSIAAATRARSWRAPRCSGEVRCWRSGRRGRSWLLAVAAWSTLEDGYEVAQHEVAHRDARRAPGPRRGARTAGPAYRRSITGVSFPSSISDRLTLPACRPSGRAGQAGLYIAGCTACSALHAQGGAVPWARRWLPGCMEART